MKDGGFGGGWALDEEVGGNEEGGHMINCISSAALNSHYAVL
jgi:hypothetical protein